MENGLLIIGLIALLFLSMYGYAYGSATLEKKRQKKYEQDLERIVAIKQEERIQRQKLRDEKLEKLRKRSQEIRLELYRLEKVNYLSTSKDQEKVEKMKAKLAKHQQAS